VIRADQGTLLCPDYPLVSLLCLVLSRSDGGDRDIRQLLTSFLRAGWFHTRIEKTLGSWLAKALCACGIVRKPKERAIVMKKLCKIAQLTGALPPVRGGKYKANVTSFTQCNRFSIPQ